MSPTTQVSPRNFSHSLRARLAAVVTRGSTVVTILSMAFAAMQPATSALAQEKKTPTPTESKAATPSNDTAATSAATSAPTKAAGQASSAQAPGTPASSPAPQTEAVPFPDLTIPPEAGQKTLEQIVTKAKGLQPKALAEYRAMQTAIRDASNQLLKLIKDKNDPVRQQAELDSLTSSAALMVNDTEEKREEVLDHILTYLEDRKELTLSDVQTGMVVAFYLELQPQKTPARDVYALIDERLENDPREEMKALRLNLQANIRRLEMLGKKFELDAKSIKGQSIKTDQLAGKFVLVDFFATWCEPCIAEVPRLRAHYEKYREKGLEVIAISIDDDRQALDKYLENNQLPWPVIYDEASDPKEKLQIRFGISSLPYVLLLNKEGVVVSLEARGAELDRLMQRIFEEPTPADPADAPTAQKPGDSSAKPKPAPQQQTEEKQTEEKPTEQRRTEQKPIERGPARQ